MRLSENEIFESADWQKRNGREETQQCVLD